MSTSENTGGQPSNVAAPATTTVASVTKTALSARSPASLVQNTAEAVETLPTSGGRYLRDATTGELTRVGGTEQAKARAVTDPTTVIDQE